MIGMIVVVHRWCYDCRGSIGGVMVTLSWYHIGGVMIVVVTSVVL